MTSTSKVYTIFIIIIIVIVTIAGVSTFLFNGGIPNIFGLTAGGDNNPTLHIEVLNLNLYQSNFPYINLTYIDIATCPVFTTAMNKIQAFSNGSITVEVTYEQRDCISNILTSHTPESQPTYSSIFKFENGVFYNIGFAIA